ncbi:TPA: histidine kinase [Campylobacter upsaliensis]|nr:histidine kinase [Campylobacter upsaliensis]
MGSKNLQNYRKIALKYLKIGDFNNALIYLSLACKEKKDEHLLNLISLCEFGLEKEQEAKALLEFYLKHAKSKKMQKDFESVLTLVMFKANIKDEFEDGHALNYRDFLESVKKIGFKKSFENIIFNAKLIIDDKKDFLNFLEELCKNGYEEAALNYIEDIFPHFWDHENFIKLKKQFKGFKGENKAK